MDEPLRPASLLILDLLSHQGVPSRDLFLLVRGALQSELVPPERLFVFSDLSHLHTGLFAPPPATATAAERVVANLALPATYTRRGQRGVYLRSLLTAEAGWDPTADMAPLLDFSLGAATAANCDTAACASLAQLKARLPAFLARIAPQLAGTRCAAAFFTHGGFAKATAPSPQNPHCLGDYGVNGVTSPEEDTKNIRDLLDAPWLAEHLVVPLARAASAPGSNGLPGRLLWCQSTCYAPPILRVVAGALQRRLGAPLTIFSRGGGDSGGGGGGGSSSGGGGGGGSSSGGMPTGHLSLLLLTHWPLLSPLQDISSLLCQTHGEDSMYPYVSDQLIKLQASLAAATNTPSACIALRSFVAPLLSAFGRVDSSLGAMVLNFEERRSVRACVPWWKTTTAGREDAAGAPAMVPPLPLTGATARPARAAKDATKHQLLVWEPQEAALLEAAPQPLETLYAAAAARGARGAKDLAARDAAPGEVLAVALLEAARELQRRRTEFGSSSCLPLAGSEEARVLARARDAWLATAVVYAHEDAPLTITHKASVNLSAGLECLLAAVDAHVGGDGGGGGGARPPAPWELTLPAAQLVSCTLLPLLDSLPFGHALVAHEKSLNETALCLCSARLLVEELDATAAAEDGGSSPLCQWVAQVVLAPDPMPPHRKYSDVPLRFRRALVKAAMEVSAARWVGTLCMLADLARHVRSDDAGAAAGAAPPSPAPAPSDAWVVGARRLAAGLFRLVSNFLSGDSSTLSPVLSWLQALRGGVTLGAFEGALNADFVAAKTCARALLGSPGGGGAVAPSVPLLNEAYVRFLHAAPRSGGVYAWGCGLGDTL
jgi:hypothetical protein